MAYTFNPHWEARGRQSPTKASLVVYKVRSRTTKAYREYTFKGVSFLEICLIEKWNLFLPGVWVHKCAMGYHQTRWQLWQRKRWGERMRGGKKDRVGRQEEIKEGGKPWEMVRKLWLIMCLYVFGSNPVSGSNNLKRITHKLISTGEGKCRFCSTKKHSAAHC